MSIENDIFRRTELLLGDDTMSRIAEKRVIIFGVGGVGSWCAESLVRSGIRKLTIVDSDRGNGTIPHITAIFGFTLAGLVVQDIVASYSE